MSINGINQSGNIYQKIASGKSINSSSDNPSGLAISEKLSSQIKGISKGTDNGVNSSSLLKTADGSAESVGEQLLRIKELAVQASNGTLNAGDKKNIQFEIKQIKDSIKDTVSQSEFNTQKLLDGSFANKNSVTGADGSGIKLNIKSIQLEDLGIEDFDVTKDFDISDIDAAIEKVSETRSDIGSMNNSIERTNIYNSVSKENIIAANSKLEGTDIGKEIIKQKSNEIVELFKQNLQKTEMDNKKQGLNLLL